MKFKDAFVKENGKWIADLSDLKDCSGIIRLQSGKEYATLSAFMEDCTPHYTQDEDHELTHWTYKTDSVVIFND